MATLRIRQLRKAAGLSQAELASAAGITQSTVSRIENGTIALDAESGAKIAHALGVEPVELHDHDAVPETESHDASVIPSMSQRPGWADVFARAKGDAPDVDAEDWETLEHAPALFAMDVPLTPALLIDLARVVRRHRPSKR